MDIRSGASRVNNYVRLALNTFTNSNGVHVRGYWLSQRLPKYPRISRSTKSNSMPSMRLRRGNNVCKRPRVSVRVELHLGLHLHVLRSGGVDRSKNVWSCLVGMILMMRIISLQKRL